MQTIAFAPTWGALERSSATMDITNPGVQKPHWLPCALASRSCEGWRKEERAGRSVLGAGCSIFSSTAQRGERAAECRVCRTGEDRLGGKAGRHRVAPQGHAGMHAIAAGSSTSSSGVE